MRNDWDLLTETTDAMKVLKIKKNDAEYKFDRKVSKNTNSMYGLEKCKGIKIDTANGSTSIVTHIGNYNGKVQCADGTESFIVPGLVKNLFSLSTVMRNDWDLLTETTDDTKY